MLHNNLETQTSHTEPASVSRHLQQVEEEPLPAEPSLGSGSGNNIKAFLEWKQPHL